MRVKLRDVANVAHVSLATVSRVVNNNPNVDETTRTNVIAVLNKLGYPLADNNYKETSSANKIITVATRSIEARQPGKAAKPNTQEETGIFYSDFDSPVIAGVEVGIRAFGFRMRIERLDFDNPTEADLEQLTQSDGIIIVGGLVGLGFISRLEKEHKPFVMVGAHLGDKEINCVLGNYVQGMAEAVAALAELGHMRIAFINGPAATTTSRDKLNGYKLGLLESGLGCDERLRIEAEDFNPPAGYKATKELLKRNRQFTAVLYASDLLAVGGLRALKEAGINVPKDVSIIGFYNGAIAQFTDPALTTVNLDRERLGEIATHRLIAMLNQQDRERLRILIPTNLIIRSSIKPALPG